MRDGLVSIIPRVCHILRSETLTDAIDKLAAVIFEGRYDCYARLWKLETGYPVDALNSKIKNSKKPLIFPGLLLESLVGLDSPITSLKLSPTDTLVLEMKIGHNSPDIFKENGKEYCEGCMTYSYGGRMCQCYKFYYCNDKCEEQDSNFHYCRTINKIYSLTEQSLVGKVGMKNLGSTCCINSCLQCLSGTYALSKYILDDTYLKDINRESSLGSKGRLTSDFANLIKKMWYGTSHPISPSELIAAIGYFNKQFIRFRQQDCQEMLGYLINVIHEDLNRIQVKPVVDNPEPRGLTEEHLAQQFWQNHLYRNDSIIVDLMHGQYRSEVECLTCGKISLTFEPFVMLSLQFLRSL